ncbi:SWIM zinc finger family protein [Streptomyces indicus]|uniref:SWIM zinc finger family protein n=1 Tax=Streptomyces indicus TaxID=417292 RepID=UPI001FE832EF|nr:SWIM zinc finger family protein [Streptomyces indicus]
MRAARSAATVVPSSAPAPEGVDDATDPSLKNSDADDESAQERRAKGAPPQDESPQGRREGHEADEARAALRAARAAARQEERSTRPSRTGQTSRRAKPQRDRPQGESARADGTGTRRPRAAAADLAGLLQSIGRGGTGDAPALGARGDASGEARTHGVERPRAGAPVESGAGAPEGPCAGSLERLRADAPQPPRTDSPETPRAGAPETLRTDAAKSPSTDSEETPCAGLSGASPADFSSPARRKAAGRGELGGVDASAVRAPDTSAVTAPDTSAVRAIDTSSSRAIDASASRAADTSRRFERDLRRTFSALPQRPTREGEFADTWWGNAWVRALEEVAADPARLKRGRGYADQGHVEAITVTPGNVLAYVQGSRQRPYRTRIRLRTLDDADWERFLDAAADHPGHLAALLDRELPQGLVDLGVDLLPGPGDLQPDCSCPDFGHPCKHAAALCYQTARLLDADPFVLLLLRGRGEHGLLDTLARRNAHRAARAEPAAPPMPGVRAAQAMEARAQALPPLPAPLPRPAQPGPPPAYPAAPGGPDPLALDQLATDAAARAHALLGTGEDPLAGLTLWQDAVRIAASQPGSGLTGQTRALYARLAEATGRSTTDLARAVAAWRQGGLDGLAVLEETWNPPAGPFDQARPALLAAEHPPFRPSHNRLTHPGGHLQLRYGRDGYWYPYESEPGRDDWWPRGTRDLDPVGALTG